jgi:hypothetical protein
MLAMLGKYFDGKYVRRYLGRVENVCWMQERKMCSEKDTEETNQQSLPTNLFIPLRVFHDITLKWRLTILLIPNGQSRRASRPFLWNLCPVTKLKTTALTIELPWVRSEVSQSSGTEVEEYEMKVD